MKQPIAGVAPADVKEVTIMTVWPSIAVYWSGRNVLGRAYEIRWPDVYFLRLGNLIALLSIPHALALYAWRILPFVGVRYTITNRRVIVQRGLMGVEEKSIGLDRFDSVTSVVQPGMAWFDAADLVFTLDGTETFRLEGVSRPEGFRHVCVNASRARAGVKRALAHHAIA